ncbi:MAG: PglZ domain-containing protein [Caldilineaceae bacterium]|nr:PglZ domain-containing protein [Caldilineaceae bacterium]
MQKRIHTLVTEIFGTGDGAWLVWCDPKRHWLPLLSRVATDRRMGQFDLVEVTERTGSAWGGPVTRVDLHARIAGRRPFVLYVPATPAELGWLWAQALLAERIYDTSLRDQLMAWGWRPHSLTVSDEEVAALAYENLQQDPAEWGSGGLQPDVNKLLDILAGFQAPDEETRLVLDLTAEQAGLPAIDDEDLPGWRRRALAMLLVTQAHHMAPHIVPETHDKVIPVPARAMALDLVNRWVDSQRLSEQLPDAIREADAVAGLAGLLAPADVTDGPFLSHAAEKACFAKTCGRLATLDGRDLMEALAPLGADIERHTRELWGHRTAGSPWAVPWGELGRLSAAVRDLLAATPSGAWATPIDAIDWYVSGGWQLDCAGEEIERSLEATSPELTALITPLRRAYRARWEETAIRWSDCWVQAGCPLPDRLGTAGAWLKAALEASTAPTAVLVVDALRYDLGASLAGWLNHQEGVTRAWIQPARAPLPSVTALGMGTALPIDEDQLEASLNDGKWQIRRKGSAGNLSIAQIRRDWWSGQGKTRAVLELPTILSGNVPEPTGNGQRLIIYDASIDRMGHDDELAFQGSRSVIQRYLDAIQRLRDQGWRRILIVTDHGFIHWSGTQEHHVPFPAPEPAYASRRAVAYPAGTPLSGPHGLAPGGKWKAAFPHGAACFRTYGGLGYFHGGASLQEWIIPCIVVEWPESAQPVDVRIEPVDRILSQRPKVTLAITASRLLPEDNIPREVEIVVRNAKTQAILFRSEKVTATGERPHLDVPLRVMEGASAARNTPLLIQARDPRTEMPLAQVDSTLMIELGGW